MPSGKGSGYKECIGTFSHDLIVFQKWWDTFCGAFSEKRDSVINGKTGFGEDDRRVPIDMIAKRGTACKPQERIVYKIIKEYMEVKYGFKVHIEYIA